MTIAACYVSSEGIVLGADSTASFQLPDGLHYLNHAQKVFEIGTNSTLGLAVWGLGGLSTSHRTLVAQLADKLEVTKPGSVSDVMDQWIDLFWTAYTTELAASIARATVLAAMPAYDPTGSVAGARSEAEENEFAGLTLGLSVGFCLGGYVLPDRTPQAFTVTFQLLGPKPTATQLGMENYGFWGAPNMVSRLLFGWDPRLRDEILGSGMWGGTPADLDAILARVAFQHLRMPIRDAIDFVHSYIFSTIKAFKFSSMSQICGGPIELAVIRTDRPFQWVQHKPWHAAMIEGSIQ